MAPPAGPVAIRDISAPPAITTTTDLPGLPCSVTLNSTSHDLSTLITHVPLTSRGGDTPHVAFALSDTPQVVFTRLQALMLLSVAQIPMVLRVLPLGWGVHNLMVCPVSLGRIFSKMISLATIMVTEGLAFRVTLLAAEVCLLLDLLPITVTVIHTTSPDLSLWQFLLLFRTLTQLLLVHLMGGFSIRQHLWHHCLLLWLPNCVLWCMRTSPLLRSWILPCPFGILCLQQLLVLSGQQSSHPLLITVSPCKWGGLSHLLWHLSWLLQPL